MFYSSYTTTSTFMYTLFEIQPALLSELLLSKTNQIQDLNSAAL